MFVSLLYIFQDKKAISYLSAGKLRPQASWRTASVLLGIFLDGQAPTEYNIYQTNRIRIVNGM